MAEVVKPWEVCCRGCTAAVSKINTIYWRKAIYLVSVNTTLYYRFAFRLERTFHFISSRDISEKRDFIKQFK
jgi:hypothetical protein